ncbi:hypothetical protein ARMSODRAFT_1022541 [Armillaria solidipes]|uniref:Uncharacterized protein n=1 Tax=Armillaria solidipes TaxID=1076256 RepID=A0A2H3B2L8_9AGAR|nr:hypothetical protein ARMSODRAFT_1022541 [Armillaria solidipes]
MSSYFKTEEIQVQVRAQSLQGTRCNTSLSDDAKLDYAAKVLTIIQYFGHSEIQHELAGDGVHSLTSIPTLESSPHTLFDSIPLCLEHTAFSSAPAFLTFRRPDKRI